MRGRSGASREYRATTHPCAEFGGLLVDYGQVAALLKTASCLPAKAPGTESLATAPHIAVGDGCSHGLFSPASRKEYWLLVDVEDQGPHRFAVEHCPTCVLDLELFDESGRTVLAHAQPSEDESPVLDHEFEEAGTYALRIAPISSEILGDFYVSANRQP